MSSLIVEVSTIDAIEPHTNADKLEMAKVKGWYCVVSKGSFKVGDKCIYIPIDAILPKEVEDKIFGPEAKVKLSKSRVRTIKIRGNISQGLVVRPEMLLDKEYPVGADVAEVLKITKFEPPEKIPSEYGNTLCQVSKKQTNSHFHKYTDIENIKHYPDIFASEDLVYVSEKLHGTSFRAGWFPTEVNTFWKKLKKMLGILPKYEFCYGSRNVQLQSKVFYKGYYGKNVYAKIVEQYDLKNKLDKGHAVYGEIVGHGIQAGYHYGCKEGEHKLYAYDVVNDGKYMDHAYFKGFCISKGIPTVPELHVGFYNYDAVKLFTKGASVLCSEQKIREGVVVKSVTEQVHPRLGRKVLKFISDEYLLDDKNTDFH